jgi:hypothetical protein
VIRSLFRGLEARALEGVASATSSMRRMLEGGSIVQYLCVAILRIVEIFVEPIVREAPIGSVFGGNVIEHDVVNAARVHLVDDHQSSFRNDPILEQKTLRDRLHPSWSCLR